MKKLISIVLISTIISFFNNLFGQKKLLDTDVFRKNPSEVTSFEEAQKEAEKDIVKAEYDYEFFKKKFEKFEFKELE